MGNAEYMGRARSCTAAGLSRETASLPRRRKLGLSTYSSWPGSWVSTSSRRLCRRRPRLSDAGGPCMLPLREGSPAHSLLHHFPLAGAAASLSVPPRRLEGSWSDRLSVSRAGFSWGPADALVSARAGTAPRRVVPHACCTARLEFCFCFLNHIDDIVPRGSVHARDRSPAHSLLHHFPLAGAAASLSVPPRRLEGSWSDRLSVSRAGFSWGPAD